MGIYQRQYQKILSTEILKYLLLGSLPNLNDISKRIGNALSKDGNVTYKFIPQASRDIFRNNIYNKSLNRIKFDIDTFNEELISLFADASSRLNYADLYYKVNNFELNRLESELNNILFSIQDADFYFSAAYDTFSDLSKIDKTASTQDIINLSEQCLALPFGEKNTQRIDVGKLATYVDTTTSVIIPGQGSDKILSNTKIPRTKFGNIFTDILSVWGHEVITSTNSPIEFSFTFPVSVGDNPELEHFISRFELVPHSLGDQTFYLSTSNDDVNYIPLLGYEQGVLTREQNKVYAFDFETTLVQYIRIKIIKTSADEEIVQDNVKNYRYVFGLKKFASLQTGRYSKATYVSLPYSFTDAIGKVSLDANQTTPPGTSVAYSVATVSKSGNTGPYVPIASLSKDSAVGAGKFIKFGSVQEQSIKFSADSDATEYGTAFQGKKFYRIGSELSESPIFGKSVLYRGFKSWYRDTSGSFEIVSVDNNYISFAVSDLEAMYIVTDEVPTITYSAANRQTELTVSQNIYYNSSLGHLQKPAIPVSSPFLDMRPNYAVYKVYHHVTNARRTTSFTLTASRSQRLPVSNFLFIGASTADKPVLKLNSGQILTKGTDYNFETEDGGDKQKPTGIMTIPDGSALLNTSGQVQAFTITFIYTIDPDITHKVTGVEANSITLSNSTITPYDSVEVIYRYIPVNSSQIIKASVRITNLPSTSSNQIFYVEGRDYVIDATSGAIQRIPTGSIPSSGSVYAKFSYRTSSSTIQTFTTWCYINSSTGIQIKFDLDSITKKNKLVVDKALGESLFVNTKEGLINITNATNTPLLPFGWVQFIVRSKNPDVYTGYKTNLIDQVIQLKDTHKHKVFRPNSYYFNDITAFREPMTEKTLNHLRVNTLLTDHSVFAIDNTTDPTTSYIVINFLPTTTSELYSKVPTDDLDEVNPPVSSAEDFLFTWTYKVEENDSPEKIIIKIDLQRDQNIDGALTPKVFDYKLRIG